MRFLTKLDPATTEAMLAQRKYDLVIFLIDTGLWAHPEDHAKPGEEGHRATPKGAPEVSILIVTPPDHVTSKLAAHSDARVVRLASDKRMIAETNGTAVLRPPRGDGRGPIDRALVGAGPRVDRYIHFSEKGARKVGDILASAIWQHFERFAATHPEAGCP